MSTALHYQLPPECRQPARSGSSTRPNFPLRGKFVHRSTALTHRLPPLSQVMLMSDLHTPHSPQHNDICFSTFDTSPHNGIWCTVRFTCCRTKHVIYRKGRHTCVPDDRSNPLALEEISPLIQRSRPFVFSSHHRNNFELSIYIALSPLSTLYAI